MATETVVLKVTMSCEGCSGAVRRVLSKMQGVESFDIDMKEQKVTVKGNVKPEEVFQTISKTGKKTAFWEGEAAAPAPPVPAAEATTAAAEAAPGPAAEAPAAASEPEITPAKADA
uniref:Copper transport protein ATX1 n=1 Tax=Zoysia japonica TaxID=309978 RepID=A0A516UX73_9POAL|nr:copper transport protein ATX1 [Zoysia japonica]